MSIKDKLLAFIREEEGLTTVEYAIAGALVAAAVVTAFTLLGTNVAAQITHIAGHITVN
jgi:pilus assembly protein Flp/PilA